MKARTLLSLPMRVAASLFAASLFGASVFSASVVSASVAAAQGGVDAETEKAEAVSLFEQGKAAYQAGRFVEAATLLESAYARFPEPVLLYNLARAYEGSARFPEAIVAYERYLKEATEVSDRPAIEQRVAALKQNEAEKSRLQEERDAAAKRAEAASRRPVETTTPSSPSPVPWIVAGVGVAGLGAGAVLGAVALSRNDGRNQVEYVDARPAAEDLALGSTIAFIAGGVVTAGGVVWGVIDVVTSGDAPREAKGAHLEVRFAPAGVALVGAF